MKEFAAPYRPSVRASSVVSVEEVSKRVFDAVAQFSGRDLPFAEDEEKAKEWLVQQWSLRLPKKMMVLKKPNRRRPTHLNLEEKILREHSKHQCLRIASWIGTDRRRFKQLIELFLNGEYRTTQRAAWIIKHCADEHPELVVPYLDAMVDRMLEPGVHDAVKRNVIRILQDLHIPRRQAGKIATVCFDMLASMSEPIAVKVFSMAVLANIAQEEPDLKNEIRILVERQMINGSAGFRSRGAKVLKQLSSSASV